MTVREIEQWWRHGSQRCSGVRAAAGPVATCAAVLLTTLVGDAQAAPKWLRLSLTDATDTTMTVTWNTDTDAGSEVLYGTSPGNLTDQTTGVSNAGPGNLGFIHEVTLTGLQPDTAYYYQAGDAVDGYSAEQPFHTGPKPHLECGTFSFLYLGDNRPDPIFGGGDNYDQILDQAQQHGAAFALVGGDLVVDGDQLDQWATFLSYTESASVTMPIMPCLGNHDTGPGSGDGANYNRIFALPTSSGPYGSNTEDYYYFVYGNVVVVALSTESFTGGQQPFKTQADYLDEVLTQHPQTWKIVIFHKPAYTKEVLFSISHPPNEEGQNAELVSIIDKHHVDVVINSHNHWYERYEPSACANQNNPGSSDPCPVGGDPAFGTIYVVSGGAGAFTIPAFLCGSQSGRAECTDKHHYMLFDVQDTSLTMQTWSAFPQPNEKFDEVVIQKTGAVDCGQVGQGGGGGSSSSGSGGGTSSTGGGGTSSTGGGSSSSGNTGANGGTPVLVEDEGCGCRLLGTARRPGGGWLALWLAAAGIFASTRRRRRTAGGRGGPPRR